MLGRAVAGWCLTALLVTTCAPAAAPVPAPPVEAARTTAAAAPTGAPAATPAPLVSVHLAQPNLAPSSTHLYVGNALGIFEQHGLSPEISVLGNAPAALAGLQAGEVEFYTGVGTAAR